MSVDSVEDSDEKPVAQDDARQALRNAEEALQRVLEDENAFKKMVKQSVREFAHDIKNPLTAMVAYSKVMSTGMSEADQYQKYSEIIHKASLRILGLCEGMLEGTESLNIDAPETEIPEDQIQDVDVSEVIEEVGALYQELADKRGISLNFDVSTEFPILHTVPRHLYRSLTNIVSNSLKFTPRGGDVSINAKLDKNDDAIIFVVRDSGQGIPAHQIPQILKPYETTPSPHGEKGTGLGLPIVYQLMLELGGNMEITSKEHQGTTVTLKFPKNMTRP